MQEYKTYLEQRIQKLKVAYYLDANTKHLAYAIEELEMALHQLNQRLDA